MPDERSPSDADLLTAFRAGESKAFEALVRRYQRAVLTIARRFAADLDDAEDLAQRAFINAAERAGGWRGGSFKSWLFRIVINLAKNHVRDTARFDRSAEAQEQEAPPTAPDAHQRLEEAERQQVLREAIARLPRRQREVAVLRYLLEYSPGEIAQLLDVPRGTVNSRLRRGLDRLEAILDREHV